MRRALSGISIVVVTRGRSPQLTGLLRSLARARRIDDTEVLIGLCGAGDLAALRDEVDRHLATTRRRVQRLPSAPPEKCRNLLATRARGDVLLFLDDDVEVRPSLIEQAFEVMADDSVAVAGGPNLTPPSAKPFEQLVGRVLASALGSGPLRHRYRLEPAQPANERMLILCGLAVRRSAFAPGFDDRLIGANENELVMRLARSPGAAVYRPRLGVYHHRRGTLMGHAKQMLKYGFGRGQFVVRAFRPRQLPFVLPTASLASFVAVAVLVPWLSLAALGLYAAVLAVGAVRVAQPKQWPLAAALFAATHVAYAVGVLVGLVYGLVQPMAPRAAAASPLWQW